MTGVSNIPDIGNPYGAFGYAPTNVGEILNPVTQTSTGQTDTGTYAPANEALPPSFTIDATQPLVNYSGILTSRIRPLALDPNVAGRLWVKYEGTVVYHTDDNGATVNKTVGTFNSPGGSEQQLLFAQGFAWLVCVGQPQPGIQVWRSPIPGPTGAGWSWTKIFDTLGMINGPAGAGGNGRAFVQARNQLLAVDASGAYLGEYSTDQIPGGPAVHYSANALTATATDITWVEAIRWPNAKHIHALNIVSGRLGVSIGDIGYAQLSPPYGQHTQSGLWFNDGTGASVLDLTKWHQRSLHQPPVGVAKQIINWLTVPFATPSGDINLIIGESDNNDGHGGPVMYTAADGTGTAVFFNMMDVPGPYFGTMRSLAMDPATRNLYWLQTGEAGSLGPTNAFMVSPPPYNTAYVLKQVATADLGVQADGIISGNYYWSGFWRIATGRFPWQA